MAKIGLLLTNLGTPDAPTPKALRKYLAEFLSDPRVITLTKLLWLPILYGIILPFRSRSSAKMYKKIWTEEGSPLLVFNQKLAKKLQERFSHEDITVSLAMRYGSPSIKDGLLKLRETKVEKLFVLPLYPQYCTATTASTFDAISHALKPCYHLPEIRLLRHYAAHPAYIETIANSIRNHWDNHGKNPFLLFSFHGIPQEYSDKGDPYESQCRQTAKLVADKLNLKSAEWQIAFQSRFGPKAWLQPYCDELLKQLPSQGIKKIDVVCPGFPIDCLETLEEIEKENAQLFIEADGLTLNYIHALNDSDQHVDLLYQLAKEELSDW